MKSDANIIHLGNDRTGKLDVCMVKIKLQKNLFYKVTSFFNRKWP